MSESDDFFKKAGELLDRLEHLLPVDSKSIPLHQENALRWRRRENHSWLEPVKHTGKLELSDLQCIDRQKEAVVRNTRQFIHGFPANNVLLWGPRGTGKSSLIKAVYNEFIKDGLRIIEVQRQYLFDLLEICDAIAGMEGRFIIFCDDLSFEANDPSYKTLKVVVDGSISTTPDNVLIYATSNRRHLVPEYMSENQQASMIDGELHHSENTEEKISLSERFGLWLAFHPFNQEQYLQIVDHWIERYSAPASDTDALHQAALRWALEHGSRSGRIAWQFARDWTGRALMDQTN